jgi:hypothetical protein
VNDRDEAQSVAQLSGYQSVHLRCSFCERLVAAHKGASGKSFICFDCVDVINQLRAESPGTSGQ